LPSSSGRKLAPSPPAGAATPAAFRIGYPFIGIAASEIEEHGYTAHLLKESEGVPEADDCHPELRPHRAALRRVGRRRDTSTARFLHPLIEPDWRISRIRLSDHLHPAACARNPSR
jgi:hypothetical protein